MKREWRGASPGHTQTPFFKPHTHTQPQVKKGPLGETSPMLCDIAAVPTWGKVREMDGRTGRRGKCLFFISFPTPPPPHQINTGMLKMYQVEVMGKLPIMQHTLFCYLFPFGR